MTLSAENNYTSDFFVDTWVPDEKNMYLAFSVQKSDKSTVIKSHDNAFYSSREILVAENWSAEKDLPGLGITEDMAANAYTIVCPDTVTTLGLYLWRYVVHGGHEHHSYLLCSSEQRVYKR